MQSDISSMLNLRNHDRVSLGANSNVMQTEPYIIDSGAVSPLPTNSRRSVNRTLRTLEDAGYFNNSSNYNSNSRQNNLNLLRGNFRKNRQDLLKSLFKENKKVHLRHSLWKSNSR